MTRIDYEIGSPVFAQDDEVGRLMLVVVDSDGKAIADLIVEGSQSLRKDIVVPTGWVERTDENGIYLNASRADLKGLPRYREEEFFAVDPNMAAEVLANYPPIAIRGWAYPCGPIRLPVKPMIQNRERPGPDEEDAPIGRGTAVESADNVRVGAVDHILVHRETQRITHLIVKSGHFLKRYVIIPAASMSSVSSSHIRLNVAAPQIEMMPEYQPDATDETIRKRLQRALDTQAATRGQGIRVEVNRGMVSLLGNVPEAIAEAAGDIAKRIRGVIGIEAQPAGSSSNGEGSSNLDRAVSRIRDE